MQNKIEAGDAVVVKPNVEDPDLNINIGGWQGRISEVDKNYDTICIKWDSLTLKNMPAEIIDQCEEKGLDWSQIYLSPTDVELVSPRDSVEDVEEAIQHLERKHRWSFLGEEGKRIQAILSQAGDDSSAFEAWNAYLQQMLEFPFEAEVSEFQERGPLQADDRVKVHGIEGSEDPYGILVSLRKGRRKYVFPLCDLEVIDETSSNYQPVNDYAVWFANR